MLLYNVHFYDLSEGYLLTLAKLIICLNLWTCHEDGVCQMAEISIRSKVERYTLLHFITINDLEILPLSLKSELITVGLFDLTLDAHGVKCTSISVQYTNIKRK